MLPFALQTHDILEAEAARERKGEDEAAKRKKKPE